MASTEFLSTRSGATMIWAIIGPRAKREGDRGAAVRDFFDDIWEGSFYGGARKRDKLAFYLAFALDVAGVYIYLTLIMIVSVIILSSYRETVTWSWLPVPIGVALIVLWSILVYLRPSSEFLDVYLGAGRRRCAKLVLLSVWVTLSLAGGEAITGPDPKILGRLLSPVGD